MTGEKSARRFTRRCLMALPVLAAGGAHAAPASKQGPKITKASKKLAGYIEKSDDSAQSCGSCHFYLAPFDCIVVEGPVSPWGYCNYYAD
jgi:hypothetical protein